MTRTLTKAQKRHRIHIITTLSQLSRDGWSGARPEDYQPLEAELATEDMLAAKRLLERAGLVE